MMPCAAGKYPFRKEGQHTRCIHLEGYLSGDRSLCLSFWGASIRNSHPKGMFSLGFNPQWHRRELHERGVKGHRNGEWVMHSHAVSTPRVLEDMLGHLPYEARQFGSGVPRLQDGAGETDLLRDVQWHQCYRQPRPEHDVRGMGIDKYIEFCHGRDVAGDCHRPTHDDQTPQLLHRFRGVYDGTRYVGERTQSNDRQILTVGFYECEQALHCLPLSCRTLWRRVLQTAIGAPQLRQPSQTVLTVDGGGRVQRAA
jgi:hypothetical protein